ncbi:MAG: hypothetical protein HPY45_17165 [Anaerolineae bacterium]|nr:hypothetical protein [Anaerolineae bacterium]
MSKNSRVALLSLLAALVLACGTQTAPNSPPAPVTAPPSPVIPTAPIKTPPQPLPSGEKPPFNPFENLNAEQKDCLLKNWGEEAFQAITSFQRPPTPQEEPAMQDCGLAAPSQPRTNEQPPQGAMPDQGPYYHQIMLARSADGLNWETFPNPIRQHASVPEIALLESGDLMIYFVDGAADNLGAIRLRPEAFHPWDSIPPQSEGLPPAYYQPEAWEDVELNFDYPPTQKMVDPDLVVIPNAVTRLFFFGATHPIKLDDPHSIYSAMGTSDGTYFGVDMGERITLVGITDPSVVYLPDGSWLMALSRGMETVLARSEDGGSFTENGVVVKSGGVPELTVLPGGALRLYVTAPGGRIASLISADGGDTWREEEGARIKAQPGNIAADPSVIQLPDGNWLMAWKQNMPSGTAPPPPSP